MVALSSPPADLQVPGRTIGEGRPGEVDHSHGELWSVALAGAGPRDRSTTPSLRAGVTRDGRPFDVRRARGPCRGGADHPDRHPAVGNPVLRCSVPPPVRRTCCMPGPLRLDPVAVHTADEHECGVGRKARLRTRPIQIDADSPAQAQVHLIVPVRQRFGHEQPRRPRSSVTRPPQDHVLGRDAVRENAPGHGDLTASTLMPISVMVSGAGRTRARQTAHRPR